MCVSDSVSIYLCADEYIRPIVHFMINMKQAAIIENTTDVS